MEQREFKAESKRLLDLMINSIYTHKEIFLREIISNASDAIDKLCYLALTDRGVGMDRSDFEIVITLDKEGRNLIVSDNGIGMDADELENNLGTIAFSGTERFRQELDKKAADGETSEGIDTDVIRHRRPDGEEKDEYSQYLREYPVYRLVKKYSDYVRFPIKLLMPHPELKEGSTEENPEYEEKFEYEVLNSMVPIWKRKKSEVTKEEYDQFYKEKFMDMEPPQSTLTVSAEGVVSYDALLYIPGKAPQGYFTDDYKPGLQLYSAGVMIMERCEDLLPDYFNFVRGVVDSPDLSLNISREMLQHDRQLKLIRDHLEKKVRGELERMLRDDREGYEKFYTNFGRQLKLCALDNYGAKKDQLKDLLLFYSSKQKKLITLSEYVSAMPEQQKYIYYASGASVEGIDRLPQTEVLK
ncbi:MAG: molecular chaperone HtpG, partial [Firmicutes bacterium]|nr:molecular chaperone HtpG [Bacillota bacterium]